MPLDGALEVFDGALTDGLAPADGQSAEWAFDATTGTTLDTRADTATDTGADTATDTRADTADDTVTSLPGCSSSAIDTVDVPSRQDIVFCTGEQQRRAKLDQCKAETLCASTWHLCTASEYRAVFAGIAPPKAGAWLAGCIRNGGALLTEPIDGICTCATDQDTFDLDVAWYVSNRSVAYQASHRHLGLISDINNAYVGSIHPETAAYWNPRLATTGFDGAVCCEGPNP